MIMRASPKSQRLGMIAASAQPNPKTAAAESRSAMRGFACLAAASAPAMEPTAMIEVSGPTPA